MAYIKSGVLIADLIPATVGQVIEVVNLYPPVKMEDIAHPCFPGYMVGCSDGVEWKRRFHSLLDETDARCIVLHLCNSIWRKKVIKKENDVAWYKLYRADDRKPIPEIQKQLLDMPFRDIKPGDDERFRFDRYGKSYIECKEVRI